MSEQDDADTYRCPVEWERNKGGYSLCKPHQCDLSEGHAGPHICNCGTKRRNMRRDWEPAPKENT